MMKVTFVLAAVAVVLTTSPPATPAKAQDLKMAQGVDVQIGRDRYDRYDRDRRREALAAITLLRRGFSVLALATTRKGGAAPMSTIATAAGTADRIDYGSVGM